MERRDVDYLIIAAMFLSGLYTALSGLVADVFGFPQIALHSTAGYVCAALAVLHLVLNWGRVKTYLKWRFTRRREREPSTSKRLEGAHSPGRRGFLVSALAATGGFALGRLLPRAPDEAGWFQPVGRPADLPIEDGDLGTLYHRWSKPGYSAALGAMSDWGGQPARYKIYADAERVALPAPYGHQGLSLEETLEARRSVRDYATESLSLDQISRLLHAAQGITEPHRNFRAAPSAGALYPIELYAVVHDVAELEAGIYHYAVQEHELELIKRGDFRAPVTQAGLWQSFLGQAGVCFVLSAIFQRTRWRYHERTYRYVMLEAGHVGQNLYLAATSMGLGACAVGAFLDDELNDLLGLDGADIDPDRLPDRPRSTSAASEEEAALYILSVGRV